MTRGRKVGIALAVVAGFCALGGGLIMVDKAQREAEIDAWYNSLPAGEDYAGVGIDCGNGPWEEGALTAAQRACIREAIEDVEARQGNDYLRRCDLGRLEQGLEVGYEPFYPNLRATVACASMGHWNGWTAIGDALARRGHELSDAEAAELQALTRTLEPTGVWSQAMVEHHIDGPSFSRRDCLEAVYRTATHETVVDYGWLNDWVYSGQNTRALHAVFARFWSAREDPAPHLRRLHHDLDRVRQANAERLVQP